MTLQLEKENKIVVENKQEFRKFCYALSLISKAKSEEVIVEDEQNEKVKEKDIDVIFSPIELSLNGKDLVKKLIVDLTRELEESTRIEQFAEIKSKMTNMLDELQQNADYDFTYDYDFGVAEFLKTINVVFEEEDDILLKVVKYIKVARRLLDKKVIILVNSEAYFSQEEIREIHKTAQYEEMYIILVESRQRTLTTETNEIIIDNDLCVI